MTIDERIKEWTKRRDRRRAKAKRSLRDLVEARRDRRQIRKALKVKRRQRDELRKLLERAPDDAERERIKRHLERNERERRRLNAALRAASREVDEAEDRLAEARARVARARKRIRHLERKAAGEHGRVISRAEWGARAPRGSYSRQGTINAGVQHHTAIPALPSTATVAQEAARMRQIQAIHQGQGWTDIGYETVVFPSGRAYEGRPEWAIGAHTAGHNTGYAGKSYDANTDATQLTPMAAATLRGLWTKRIGSRRLYGHRDLGPTACPGRDLYDRLREIH